MKISFCVLHMLTYAYSNMIVHILAQEFAAKIESVEVHVEGVHLTIAAIIHNNCCTRSSVRLSSAVWLNAVEPSGARCYIIIGGKIDTLATIIVQDIKILERQRRGVAIHKSKVDLEDEAISVRSFWRMAILQGVNDRPK